MGSYTGSLALALSLVSCAESTPLEVAPDVELARFQGSWYEIASLPRASQLGCTRTTARYELASPTELLVIHECREGRADGPVRRVAARAVVADPAVPAKLALDFGWAFGDYWILEVGESYEYAVIGHPLREHLWILSRTPALGQVELEAALARAHSKGFPTGALRYTPQ